MVRAHVRLKRSRVQAQLLTYHSALGLAGQVVDIHDTYASVTKQYSLATLSSGGDVRAAGS